MELKNVLNTFSITQLRGFCSVLEVEKIPSNKDELILLLSNYRFDTPTAQETLKELSLLSIEKPEPVKVSSSVSSSFWAAAYFDKLKVSSVSEGWFDKNSERLEKVRKVLERQGS
jgi:hypothetical protein